MSTVSKVVIASLLLWGCGQSTPEGSAAQRAPTPNTKAPVAQPAPQAATDTIQEASFELKAAPQNPYKVGQQAKFGISLTPKGAYHVNEDFPIRISLTAPSGVTLPKAALERTDAAEFGKSKVRFDIPFTPAAAGTHQLQAKVEFAVCTPENCVPDERTLAVALAAQ